MVVGKEYLFSKDKVKIDIKTLSKKISVDVNMKFLANKT